MQKLHTWPFNTAQCNLVCNLSGVWENCHGGPHTNQQEQQLSDVPSGCASALQVSEWHSKDVKAASGRVLNLYKDVFAFGSYSFPYYMLPLYLCV